MPNWNPTVTAMRARHREIPQRDRAETSCQLGAAGATLVGRRHRSGPGTTLVGVRDAEVLRGWMSEVVGERAAGGMRAQVDQVVAPIAQPSPHKAGSVIVVDVPSWTCGQPIQVDLLCNHCGLPVTNDTIQAEPANA
jgi:hypothetical protein